MDQNGSDLDRDRVSSAASELVWQRYQELKGRGWRDSDARAEAANGDRDLARAYSHGCQQSLERFQQRQGQAVLHTQGNQRDIPLGLPTRHYDELSPSERARHSPWLRRLQPGEPEPVGRTMLHKLSSGPDGGLFVLEGA